MRRIPAWRFLALLALVAVIGSSTLAVHQPAAAVDTAAVATASKAPYLVRLAAPNQMVVANAPATELANRAHEQRQTDLAVTLARLALKDEAGQASYDAGADAFRVDLTDGGRAELASSRLVASVQPAGLAGTRSAQSAAPPSSPLPPLTTTAQRGAQSVGSINFVQVYTPFMWGRTNLGGLNVTITLENSGGTVKGVAAQTLQAAPNNYIQIDRTQLYYETFFKDPNDPAHPPVLVLPGDRVHVVTTGVDPTTGSSATEDKRIVVDDIQAWTSYEQDAVSGIVPAGSDVIVTVDTGLSLTSYLTPGSYMTFNETTAGSDGKFTAGTFRSSADSTLRKIDLQQGTTGFVRVHHPDGNEVYTVHGQNVLVLENSEVVHGYAFRLPMAPLNLDNGVALLRPEPSVSVTLRSATGTLKDSVTILNSFINPYKIAFTNAIVAAGDYLEVSIFGAPARVITIAPMTSTVDLAGNQIRGTGPANTQMVVQAGRISGYVSASSYYDFLVQRPTTDGGGSFASGPFACGSSGYLSLQPGSFGLVGYEDARGNFIYESVAAPTNSVLSDYPFVEGWLPDGATRPTVTVRDAGGTVKHQSTAKPLLIYLILQKLYVNVYYNVLTSQYVEPTDVVTVAALSGTATIPVDRVTAYVNTDNDTVVGDAPAGASIRVIPKGDRASYRLATADSSNSYSAGNPFQTVVSYDCSLASKTEDLAKGQSGRAYYQHADGNSVFAVWGRAMHVNQNENNVELYPFLWRELDWWGNPTARTVSVTLTPRVGSPLTVGVLSEMSESGHTNVNLVDGQGQRALIRTDDTVTATFDEGPNNLKRTITLALNSQAMVLGTPDVDTNTVAGLGPRGWNGAMTLNGNALATPTIIQGGTLTAWGPKRFYDAQKNVVPLARGYSGVVSFTDRYGTRLWSAWAAPAYPVKISGWLDPGDTQVCGTAVPGGTVRIHDFSSETQDVILATGTVDGQGHFCAVVSPLVKNQVILAEVDGTFSQPVVVGAIKRSYISFVVRVAQ